MGEPRFPHAASGASDNREEGVPGEPVVPPTCFRDVATSALRSGCGTLEPLDPVRGSAPQSGTNTLETGACVRLGDADAGKAPTWRVQVLTGAEIDGEVEHGVGERERSPTRFG